MEPGNASLPPDLTGWVREWSRVDSCPLQVAQVALSRRLSGWQYEGWLSRLSCPIYVTARGEDMLRTLRDAADDPGEDAPPQGHPQVPYSS